MENIYKLGDKVKVINTGYSYPHPFHGADADDPIIKYFARYRPINVKFLRSFDIYTIISGFDTENDLALKDNLIWKIKYIYNFFNGYSRKILYFLQSNENHLLVITSDGFRMLNEEEK